MPEHVAFIGKLEAGQEISLELRNEEASPSSSCQKNRVCGAGDPPRYTTCVEGRIESRILELKAEVLRLRAQVAQLRSKLQETKE